MGLRRAALRRGARCFFIPATEQCPLADVPCSGVMRGDAMGKAEQSAMGDERYRILVEAVTDYAIYMLDPAGTIGSWNRGAERFKGYTALEVLGTNFSRFYTDADRARGLPAFALGTAAREGRFESEGWRVRKDGTTFWASVVIDAIYGTDGELLGFAKITRDLSERREA